MKSIAIDSATLDRLEELMRANLASRDAIYDAAARLDGEALRRVCTRLAQELGGNVADLTQILVVNGRRPVKPDDPLVQLIRAELERETISSAPETVVDGLSSTEEKLITRYAATAASTTTRHARDILETHSRMLEKAKDTLDAVKETMVPKKIGKSRRKSGRRLLPL